MRKENLWIDIGGEKSIQLELCRKKAIRGKMSWVKNRKLKKEMNEAAKNRSFF